MPPEIRTVDDGSLDEVVALNCDFRLERISDGELWIVIGHAGGATHIALRSFRDAILTDISHSRLR